MGQKKSSRLLADKQAHPTSVAGHAMPADATEARRYFGTDGLRGEVNRSAMTAQTVLRLGLAVGKVFQRGSHRHRAVIGKDTRLSGYMVETALVAGLTSMGLDVFLFGPIPTPAVGYLTRSLRADVGVMISASHNAFCDNGTKLFGPDGRKLSDALEHDIEQLMDNDALPLAVGNQLGRAKRIDDAQARYIEHAKRSVPRRMILEGMRIVIDCAHGAGYKVAPETLWELGADVKAIGVSPNGVNINAQCGATDTIALAKAVQRHKADIGIALDGDADRVMICDEHGKTISGDQLLAFLAKDWQVRGDLEGGAVVGTQMSNLGLERFLSARNLRLHRSRVGDRYVAETMQAHGCNIGGESSGHIILSNYTTTGDGVITALQILAGLQRHGKPASELLHCFEAVPQFLDNIPLPTGVTICETTMVDLLAKHQKPIGKTGRLVLRKSGTEPLLRLMGEGEDELRIRAAMQDLRASIDAHMKESTRV